MRESGSGLYSDLRVLGGSSASNAVLFLRDDFYGGTFDSSLRKHSCADLSTQCNFSNVRVSLPASIEGIVLHFISPGAIGSPQTPLPYLFSWGIPVAHHLPYVGTCLYDNSRYGISFIPSRPIGQSLIQVVAITECGTCIEATSNIVPAFPPPNSVFIHSSASSPLYLTLATVFEELLIVGGFDGVFEICNQFRNEGIDLTHNPEFSTCEFYVAYADYNDLMDHIEKMLNGVVKELTSGYKIKHYANGRFIDLINEVVNQHRLIFISSTGPAGKAGPALNTVGAPGGTTSSITGVGEYVSPALGAGAHCVVEPPAEGLQYTWSSRGSTGDDDRGICISAPGGAVAIVLTWTFQRCMLMNGTSMASPSACGGVALLISAMKWTVQVELLFHEDASNLEQLLPFEECLKLHATEKEIVQAPEYLLLTNNGQSFNIVDDPTNLRDIMHYFELYGVDCKAPWRGPLFRVLITMARPIVLTDKTPLITFSEMRFVPGHKERRFIEVPRGANSFEVTMRTLEYTARRLFIVTLRICPLERQIKWKRADTFASPSAKGVLFPLEDGQTMELSVAQFWSCGIGSQEITITEFEFKDEEEVVAVTAHEIAHWKLNHTAFSFIAVQILTILQFGGYTLVKNPKALIQSFGFDTASTHWAHPLSAYSDSRSNPCQPSFLNFRKKIYQQ